MSWLVVRACRFRMTLLPPHRDASLIPFEKQLFIPLYFSLGHCDKAQRKVACCPGPLGAKFGGAVVVSVSDPHRKCGLGCRPEKLSAKFYETWHHPSLAQLRRLVESGVTPTWQERMKSTRQETLLTNFPCRVSAKGYWERGNTRRKICVLFLCSTKTAMHDLKTFSGTRRVCAGCFN